MRLSIVIPAFNEEGRLPMTLEAIAAYLADSAAWRPTEIIVVDDGSDDATAVVAEDFRAGPEIDIHCLSLPRNRGKGAAVRAGFLASEGASILLCDADMATPISELDRLAGAAPTGVAIGSRALERTRIERRQPVYRDLMGRCFNLAVRLLAVGGIRDTQCGFKLFEGDLGRRLAAAQRLDGFAFDVELLVLARSWGREIAEVPVRWRHVDESRVSPVTHSTEMLLDVVRLRWWRITGRMQPPGDLGS